MHWTPLKIREIPLTTSWQADQIVVTRGDELIDLLPADAIERVTLVHAGEGEIPGDVRAAIFELNDRVVLLCATSGIGGRVLFERQSWWSLRNCIYWVNERCVAWPELRGESHWPFARRLPLHRQLGASAGHALFDRSDATGPHTWDQRKQHRIERRRPFRGRLAEAVPTDSNATT